MNLELVCNYTNIQYLYMDIHYTVVWLVLSTVLAQFVSVSSRYDVPCLHEPVHAVT